MQAEPASKDQRPAPDAAWSLRPARPADAVAWHALQLGIYQEGHAFVGDGPQAPAALAAQLRSLQPGEGTVLVAVDGGGALLGWVEAYRGVGRRLAHVATLTLAVAAPWRRRGIGRALMTALEEWGLRLGLRKLQLRVRAGNTSAIALYERIGYRLEGVLRDQVATFGASVRFEDEWIMALELPVSGRRAASATQGTAPAPQEEGRP